MPAKNPGANERLRRALDEAGHGSATRLADCLGLRTSTITRWRNGQESVGRKWWPAIEECLGLDEGDLAAAAAPTPPADRLDDLDRTVDVLLLAVAHLMDAEISRRRGRLPAALAEVAEALTAVAAGRQVQPEKEPAP